MHLLNSIISIYCKRELLEKCHTFMEKKIAFTVYVYNGIIYIRWLPFVITGYSGLAMLLYCFYLSNLRFREKNENWYKYHLLFHCIMTYEQLIILLSL